MADIRLTKPQSHTLRMAQELEGEWIDLIQRTKDLATQSQAAPIPLASKADGDQLIGHAEVPSALVWTVGEFKASRLLRNAIRAVITDTKDDEMIARNIARDSVDGLRKRGGR